jgi:hypothetical protein
MPPSMLELQPSTLLPTGISLSPTPPPLPASSSPPVTPLPFKRTRKQRCKLELFRQEDIESHLNLSLLSSSPLSPRLPVHTTLPRQSSLLPLPITEFRETTKEPSSLPRPPSRHLHDCYSLCHQLLRLQHHRLYGRHRLLHRLCCHQWWAAIIENLSVKAMR